MTTTMPHLIHNWVISDRVLLLNVGKHMDLATIQAMDALLIDYLDAANEPLHIIFDNTDLAVFPNDLHVLSASIQFTKHPNLGWRVIFGANKVVQFLGRVTSKMSGTSRFHYVDSFDESLSFVLATDATVPKPDSNAAS